MTAYIVLPVVPVGTNYACEADQYHSGRESPRCVRSLRVLVSRRQRIAMSSEGEPPLADVFLRLSRPQKPAPQMQGGISNTSSLCLYQIWDGTQLRNRDDGSFVSCE